MKKEELEKIVLVVTNELEKNFNKHKKNYTLEELEVIPFFSKNLNTRKVSDWGTDEDTDNYIWYSEKGWEYVKMTVQYGAGASKVIENNVSGLSKQEVVNEVLKMNLIEQMEFIYNAYEVLALSEYRKELL